MISHIRKPLPPKRGNSFYRDKTDYTKFALTLCGAAVTDRDIDWQYAGTKKCQEAMRKAQWPVCEICAKLRVTAA